MLTKYALVAIIVLCCTVLGFTLMVGDSLCELSIRPVIMIRTMITNVRLRTARKICVNRMML